MWTILAIILFIFVMRDVMSGKPVAFLGLIILFLMTWLGISYGNLKNPEVKLYQIQELSDPTNPSVVQFSVVGPTIVIIKDVVKNVRVDINTQALKVETYKNKSWGISWDAPSYSVVLRSEQR